MYPYNCDELLTDISNLACQCRDFAPDVIIAVTRGGMIPAQLLAYALDIRRIAAVSVESYDEQQQRETLLLRDDTNLEDAQRVLIVDDIIDSGATLHYLLEHFALRYPAITFKSASIYYKPTAAVQPDFTCKEATEWIDFFWERMPLHVNRA